mmetsp:Transcript_65705/g.165580  ORF Transcript_65705/g.165580 Transcript_65705/m.165580 type:complete len:352 (-) Transcript_65705:926-1981(-)
MQARAPESAQPGPETRALGPGQSSALEQEEEACQTLGEPPQAQGQTLQGQGPAARQAVLVGSKAGLEGGHSPCHSCTPILAVALAKVEGGLPAFCAQGLAPREARQAPCGHRRACFPETPQRRGQAARPAALGDSQEELEGGAAARQQRPPILDGNLAVLESALAGLEGGLEARRAPGAARRGSKLAPLPALHPCTEARQVPGGPRQDQGLARPRWHPAAKNAFLEGSPTHLGGGLAARRGRTSILEGGPPDLVGALAGHRAPVPELCLGALFGNVARQEAGISRPARGTATSRGCGQAAGLADLEGGSAVLDSGLAESSVCLPGLDCALVILARGPQALSATGLAFRAPD